MALAWTAWGFRALPAAAERLDGYVEATAACSRRAPRSASG
jgi:hypothetical protein